MRIFLLLCVKPVSALQRLMNSAYFILRKL